MRLKGLCGKLPDHLKYEGHFYQPQYDVQNGQVYACLEIVCQFDEELKNYRVFFTYYEPYSKYILSAPKELFDVIDNTIPEFWVNHVMGDNNLFSISDPDLIKYPYLLEQLADSEPKAIKIAKDIIARNKTLW